MLPRFVDRDMFMRYQIGFGVGHRTEGQPPHGRRSPSQNQSEFVEPRSESLSPLPRPGQELTSTASPDNSRPEGLDIEEEPPESYDSDGEGSDSEGSDDERSDSDSDADPEGESDEVDALDDDDVEMHGC